MIRRCAGSLPLRALAAAAVLLVNLACLAAAAGGEQGATAFGMRAQPVADGVYAIITPSRSFPDRENLGWNSNSGFVVTEAGVLLFDSGSSEAIGRAIAETIAGVTAQPVRWVVNSHAHGDHWLGNAAFAGEGVEIISTTQVRNAIRVGGRSWVQQFKAMTGGATGDSPVVEPHRLVDARTVLDLGGTEVVLFPSNDSHSPGDIILWLPQQRVLMTGDVVYVDRMPSTFASNLRNWLQMLAQLQDLDPIAVIPGHGELTDRGGLERLQQLLATLWGAVESGYAAGKADFEMLADVAAALEPFRELYPGMDEKLSRDISHVYLQVERAAFE